MADDLRVVMIGTASAVVVVGLISHIYNGSIGLTDVIAGVVFVVGVITAAMSRISHPT